MQDNVARPSKAIILTALPVEYQAVREHLADLQEETHPKGTIYERGTFAANGNTWEIGIVQIGAGNPGTATEVERAVDYFRAGVVLFVGVAGGLKDVRLGDVVAATKVYGYESGKANITFQPRPEVGNSTYSMERRAQAEANKASWLQRLKGPLPDLLPRVFVGPIAAGEKVIASTYSSSRKLLKANYGDALAVEMEGYGFIKAIHANQHVNALIIRGISDLIDGKSEADANNWQEIASRHASAFAFEVLARLRGDTSRGVQRGPKSPDKPKQPLKRTPPASKFNIQNKGTIHHQIIGDNPHLNTSYGKDPKEL